MNRSEPPSILPVGTQVVTQDAFAPRGGGDRVPAQAVGVVVEAPADATHRYVVRFPDGREAALRRRDFRILKSVQSDGLERGDALVDFGIYREHVIYECIVGSRAYGLDNEESDTDRRGVYLPPADRQWSLYGVPEQIEDKAADECYWELAKFLRLALKANPNVLECLWTPLVEHVSPIAEGLLELREAVLSRLAYHTYNGYALSQFRKLEQDIRTRGTVKWKHAMHLVRLLIAGITLMREGRVLVDVGEHRGDLLAIRNGERAFEDLNVWRLALHADFDQAFAETSLPERPDYDRVNTYLLRARRSAL